MVQTIICVVNQLDHIYEYRNWTSLWHFFFSPNVIPLTIGPKFLDNVGALIFLKYNWKT